MDPPAARWLPGPLTARGGTGGIRSTTDTQAARGGDARRRGLQSAQLKRASFSV